MTSPSGWVRLASAATMAAVLGAQGCLPIPYTKRVSPAIDGVYRRSDETPVAGARMVLSTEYNDSTCATPAQSTTTDSDGRFAFASTTRRQSYVLLLPYDALYCYRVCGDTPAGVPRLRAPPRPEVRVHHLRRARGAARQRDAAGVHPAPPRGGVSATAGARARRPRPPGR